jgi:hypothetical protein
MTMLQYKVCPPRRKPPMSTRIARPSTLSCGPALVVLAVAALNLTGAISRADTPAIPPCDADFPPTSYASLGAAPTIQIWNQSSAAAAPATASCLASFQPDLRMLVSVAGSFKNSTGTQGILARFGEVSKLLSVRYWSTTDQQLRPLVLAATALTTRDSGQPREDFSNAELLRGQDVYFSQKDSRGAGEVVYRARVLERSSVRLVIETENVTPVRWFALTLLKRGGLRASYFFSQRSPGVWTYHSVTGIAEGSWLLSGHEKSYINRVVALYRHIVGIPTDQEPPAAP